MSSRSLVDVRDVLDRPVDFYPSASQLMTEPLETVMQDALAEGYDAMTVYSDVLPDAQARQFRDNPEYRELVREYFESAGITMWSKSLVSSTKHGNPQSWSGVIADLRRHVQHGDADVHRLCGLALEGVDP